VSAFGEFVAAALGNIGLLVGLIGIGLGVVAVVRRASNFYAILRLLSGIGYWCWIFSIAFGRF
jgi:ABC-type antimicrobial peptide transport system permease subunit